jgi:hypothetical protein
MPDQSTAAAPAAGTNTTIYLLSGAAFFSGAALRVCDALLPRLAPGARLIGFTGRDAVWMS